MGGLVQLKLEEEGVVIQEGGGGVEAPGGCSWGGVEGGIYFFGGLKSLPREGPICACACMTSEHARPYV